MHLDFTLYKYRQLCEEMLKSEYIVSTVVSYLENSNPGCDTVVLRHDVDLKPERALQMAQLEGELGIRSTYYFRMIEGIFQPRIITGIAEMGHEIGYHYETMDKAKGDYEEAIKIFVQELEELREIVGIKTICMHGNSRTKWDNRDLWGRYDFKEHGIVGEAYLSFDNIIYLSDTGRTWSGKHKVKDWLPSAGRDCTKRKMTMSVSSTDDLIGLMKRLRGENVYIQAHPNKWTDNRTGWTLNLLRDTMGNRVKRVRTFSRTRNAERDRD